MDLYECMGCGKEVTEDESESVCVFPGTYYDQPEYDTLCQACYDKATEWAVEDREDYDERERWAREDESDYLAGG